MTFQDKYGFSKKTVGFALLQVTTALLFEWWSRTAGTLGL